MTDLESLRNKFGSSRPKSLLLGFAGYRECFHRLGAGVCLVVVVLRPTDHPIVKKWLRQDMCLAKKGNHEFR